MQSSLHLNIGNCWDDTFLQSIKTNPPENMNNCIHLFVELTTVGDEGGFHDGVALQSFMRFEENPGLEVPIFPGSLMVTGNGTTLEIVNQHPFVDVLQTIILMDGIDITDLIDEIRIDLNAEAGTVEAFYIYYNSGVLGISEEVCVTFA